MKIKCHRSNNLNSAVEEHDSLKDATDNNIAIANSEGCTAELLQREAVKHQLLIFRLNSNDCIPIIEHSEQEAGENWLRKTRTAAFIHLD